MTPTGRSHDSYRDEHVTFGTRHGKEHQAARPFETILGARVSAPVDLDTDQYGTFTGEIARQLAAVDAALAKARLAVAATGHRFALASEASYGHLPGLSWPGSLRDPAVQPCHYFGAATGRAELGGARAGLQPCPSRAVPRGHAA